MFFLKLRSVVLELFHVLSNTTWSGGIAEDLMAAKTYVE